MERPGTLARILTLAVLLGAVPVVLVSLPAGLRVPWHELEPLVWLGVLYAVLISACLGWLLWGWVNAVRGVATTAPLSALIRSGRKPDQCSLPATTTGACR